ncbi:MAG TPA: hypothetical protein VG943_02320 [Caulobacterales bacterium]|nr:hypothetical protein [Caulobacterales bacterium]
MLGVWSAFLFNICLALLPLASAFALVTVSRDHLYTYEATPALAQDVRNRVERLASTLIPLDFDRRRQWDDMVAIELVKGDISAARGFLLSARTMLPARDADQLNRSLHSNATDADIETAALDFLTPGTRARYESSVPLLSRRSASGLATTRAAERLTPLGDARDFELLAGSMMGDADSDPLHFTLTGLGLGLGGPLTPRMSEGASALIEASRDPNFGGQFAEEITNVIGAAAPADRFRSEALARAHDGADPASYPIAAPAFRAAIDPVRAAAAKAVLDQIGAMSEASSPSGAALLLTHARSIRDLPRLQLIALAAGDRATAVAKNAPHDGRLPAAAHGVLKFSNELLSMLGFVALAAIGLIFSTAATAIEAAQRAWRSVRAEHFVVRTARGDLVESFDAPWRTL